MLYMFLPFDFQKILSGDEHIITPLGKDRLVTPEEFSYDPFDLIPHTRSTNSPPHTQSHTPVLEPIGAMHYDESWCFDPLSFPEAPLEITALLEPFPGSQCLMSVKRCNHSGSFLNSQSATSFGPAPFEHQSTCLCSHPFPETMSTFSFYVAGLKCTFHLARSPFNHRDSRFGGIKIQSDNLESSNFELAPASWESFHTLLENNCQVRA